MSSNKTLEIQDTVSDEHKGLVVIRKWQLFWIAIIAASVVAGVGLLCYYIPDRSCEFEAPVTEHTITTEQMATEDILTTEQLATEEPYPCRLPGDVVPISYELSLKPYLNEEDVEGTTKELFTFDGNVVITIKCKTETNRITLHSRFIEISSVSLIGGDLDIIPTWEYGGRYPLVHIDLGPDQYLQMGEEYSLTIVYVGQLNDMSLGFYRGSYNTSTGHTS